jgi:O-antigen/teichoic acid export membrane protein
VVVIAQSAGDFGLAQAAVAVLPNPATLRRPFPHADLEAGVALAFLLAAVGATLLCMLAAALVPGSAALAVIAIAPTAACAIAVAGADGILRSAGDFRRPVIYVGASRLGAFAGVPAGLATGSPSWTCAAVSAGTLLCSLPALSLLFTHLRGGGRARQPAAAFAAAAFPLALSNIAVIASARLNTVILGGFSSLRAAAVFESSWRLFQVGQYAIGAAPTAAGPFIADALSKHRRDDLKHALRRAALMIVGAGAAFALIVIAVRGPLDRALFGSLGPSVDGSIVVLAPALPANLLALLMTITLASVSGVERRWIAISYAIGAAFNIGVIVITVNSDPQVAGAAGAAAGVTATAVVLLLRVRMIVRDLARVPVGPTQIAAHEQR